MNKPTLADEQCRLTEREYEVISMIVFDGCTNQELAEHLGISEKTVKNHVANIFKKLNISSVRKLMSICMRSLLADGGIHLESSEKKRARLAQALGKMKHVT